MIYGNLNTFREDLMEHNVSNNSKTSLIITYFQKKSSYILELYKGDNTYFVEYE